jgi:hypothetical protein
MFGYVVGYEDLFVKKEFNFLRQRRRKIMFAESSSDSSGVCNFVWTFGANKIIRT